MIDVLCKDIHSGELYCGSHRLKECFEMLKFWVPDVVIEQLGNDDLSVSDKLKQLYEIYKQQQQMKNDDGKKEKNDNGKKQNDDVSMGN